jgi:hypothetical protein
VPTPFVGIHLGLAFLVAVFGLSFLADPCGGGGDLCLGGAVGLFALGIAAIGGIGLAVWQFAHRASPLLVWDCVLLAMSGFIVLSGGGYSPILLTLSALLATLLSLAGAALTGRAVIRHRIEPLVAVALTVLLVIVGRETALIVLVLVLLTLGWSRLARGQLGQAA